MQTNTQTTQKKLLTSIYANRMDNGDTVPGDGWRFRGGGISAPGRYNYTEFGKAVEMSEEAVDYVRTQKGALDSMLVLGH